MYVSARLLDGYETLGYQFFLDREEIVDAMWLSARAQSSPLLNNMQISRHDLFEQKASAKAAREFGRTCKH